MSTEYIERDAEAAKAGEHGGGLPFLLGVVSGCLLTGAAALATLALFRLGAGTGEASGRLVDAAAEQKLGVIQENISRNFYRTDVTEETLRDGLYRGVLSALEDPYSCYYSKEEFADIMSDIEGVYEGIGAYLMLSEKGGYPVITGTMSGSPAELAGLAADDLLVEVEGESTKGLDLSTVVSRVKGAHGTSVRLGIQRGTEQLKMSIVRDRIEAPTVETEGPVDGLGYLQITEFDDVTPDQFTEGLAELKARGMTGLLLDLRSNTGGNLDAVCDIARSLLPAGVIVYTLDRNGRREDYNCDGKHAADYPIVVLTNGYTASASEILSGAIRDYGLGKLVGTTTYGKGVVQRIYEMGDGSAMKLTVESYYTPSGFDLNGVGIEPDEVVELDMDALAETGIDNQRARGEEILRAMMEERAK